MISTLTYRRPEPLGRLLPELAKQARTATGLGWETRILVVDNDPEASGQPTVQAFNSQHGQEDGHVEVEYAVEPAVGISAARNRVLQLAQRSDFLAFIDDDEIPLDNWLENLISTQERHNAAAVVGLVVPHYETSPDEWILAGKFFERPTRPTGTQMPCGFAGNLLLEMASVSELGLRFDNRFGLSGGEDTLFTMQLVASGRTIIWCNEAQVADFVPSSRLTRRWVLHRRFSAANTQVLCELALTPARTARVATRLLYAGGGLGRILFGLGRFGFGALRQSVEDQAQGLRLVARGSGLVVGAFGYRYLEYRRE